VKGNKVPAQCEDPTTELWDKSPNSTWRGHHKKMRVEKKRKGAWKGNIDFENKERVRRERRADFKTVGKRSENLKERINVTGVWEGRIGGIAPASVRWIEK